MSTATSTFHASSAEGYERMMGRWSRLVAAPLVDHVGLVDGCRALDAGCGTGALTAELLARDETASVVGVDLAEAYVDSARAQIQDARVEFEIGDVTALQHEDASFDQVFTNLVLQFVPDTDAALRELARVLKPGGRIAATVWDARGGLVFNRMFLDTAAVIDPAGDALRARMFTRPLMRPGELVAAWDVHGFIDLDHGEITVRTEFASFEDYWAPLDGQDGPIPNYLRGTAPDLRGRIKDAVRRAYLDGEQDGPRSYTATSWVISGRKPIG